jgi:hypothetical protein
VKCFVRVYVPGVYEHLFRALFKKCNAQSRKNDTEVVGLLIERGSWPIANWLAGEWLVARWGLAGS